MHRINASPRIRYSRELQRSNEQKSLLFKIFAGIAFLALIFYFFRDSGARTRDSDTSKADLPKIYEDVKIPEVKASPKPPPVVILNEHNRPKKYKYSELCEDEPSLLNEEHKSCEIRLDMIRHMGLTCDDDKNTAVSCCRSCKMKHLTHEHAHRKKNAKGEETNEACLDMPGLLADKYGSSYTCKKLLESMFYTGEECASSEEAQEKCCHSCVESPFWNEDHCEDYPHMLTNGDCNSLFKRLALKRGTCSGTDESRFCCKTCDQLEKLYGENACLNHDYKLNFGTCSTRVLELQKMEKMCDDDAEVLEHCCQACHAHEHEGCFDTMIKFHGKTCAEAVVQLGDGSSTPCKNNQELEDKCCRSCDPDRCDDTFALVRGNECRFNVKNMKALGMESCDEEEEIKEKCCHSCSKAFPDKYPR